MIDEKITNLQPGNFSYGDRLFFQNGEWKLERSTDFRTHPKFGKRIYYAFRPVWWIIHFWDWAVADRFIPQLSYGFSTLTAYPDAGNPGTTTKDARLTRDVIPEDWSVIQSGSGNDGDGGTGTSNDVQIVSGGTSGKWGRIDRSVFLFDTSALGSGASISAVVLSLYASDKYLDFTATDFGIDIYTSTPASNTAYSTADFSQIGSTSQTGAPIVYGSWTLSAYNTFTFNSTGRANISKTSISKFGARESTYDAANIEPTWQSFRTAVIQWSSADVSGTTQDPKLVITYTSSTAWTKH